MNPLDRRELLGSAAAGTALAMMPAARAARQQKATERSWKIVDTNVSLFPWPFRRLPLDTTARLVEKLRSLQIAQAWAGSFEGLLHRDVAGVNARLADACAEHGQALLRPVGTVNLALPDWEEDVRRCHAEHKMRAIRLHPNYHGYALDDARFGRLLAMVSERKLLVQLAVAMEDRRTQHPLAQVADVDLAPLAAQMKQHPAAKLLLLNYRPSVAVLQELAKAPGVYFDTARVESTDGIAKLVRSVPRERVVFGTHAPFLIYEAALIRVAEARLEDEETRALLEQNARRIIE